MGGWGEPFVGSEALRCEGLNRHQLRMRYRAVLPNVYLSKLVDPLLEQRIAAAWLWSRREATIAGLAAAALHGTKWIDDDVPIELIYPNSRPPQGVVTRRDVLLDGERQSLADRLVTTPERTAFDLGRRGTILSAVARLDALARATGIKMDDVADLAKLHSGVRGLRHLETVLDLVDPGAQSPKESWLRMVLMKAGFPKPTTQIPVLGSDGIPIYYLDMGWEECLLAAEYDGLHHQLDRSRYVKDIHRLEEVQDLGWHVVRVVAEDRRADVIRRVRPAWEARASGVSCI